MPVNSETRDAHQLVRPGDHLWWSALEYCRFPGLIDVTHAPVGERRKRVEATLLGEFDDCAQQLLRHNREVHGAETIECEHAHPTLGRRVTGDLFEHLARRCVRQNRSDGTSVRLILPEQVRTVTE